MPHGSEGGRPTGLKFRIGEGAKRRGTERRRKIVDFFGFEKKPFPGLLGDTRPSTFVERATKYGQRLGEVTGGPESPVRQAAPPRSPFYGLGHYLTPPAISAAAEQIRMLDAAAAFGGEQGLGALLGERLGGLLGDRLPTPSPSSGDVSRLPVGVAERLGTGQPSDDDTFARFPPDQPIGVGAEPRSPIIEPEQLRSIFERASAGDNTDIIRGVQRVETLYANRPKRSDYIGVGDTEADRRRSRDEQFNAGQVDFEQGYEHAKWVLGQAESTYKTAIEGQRWTEGRADAQRALDQANEHFRITEARLKGEAEREDEQFLMRERRLTRADVTSAQQFAAEQERLSQQAAFTARGQAQGQQMDFLMAMLQMLLQQQAQQARPLQSPVTTFRR
jgi:hypothetical protein